MYSYTYMDILNALKNAGLGKDDSVFIHSNLGFFGQAENVHSAEELAKIFFDAMKECVGANGTIITPAFTYSYCHGELYNPKSTPTKCGMLPEYMRVQDDCIRSNDPNFSIVAWGKNKVYFTENPTHESFGINSFWERLLKKHGKILCMNFDCGSTFIHYVEKVCKVPYRYNKAFNGESILDGKKIKDYYVHWVYDMEKPQDGASMEKLSSLCIKNGIATTVKLGRGNMHLMETESYFNFIQKHLLIEPYFLTLGGQDAKQ